MSELERRALLDVAVLRIALNEFCHPLRRPVALVPATSPMSERHRRSRLHEPATRRLSVMEALDPSPRRTADGSLPASLSHASP
jgi:hypothetical protein